MCGSGPPPAFLPFVCRLCWCSFVYVKAWVARSAVPLAAQFFRQHLMNPLNPQGGRVRFATAVVDGTCLKSVRSLRLSCLSWKHKRTCLVSIGGSESGVTAEYRGCLPRPSYHAQAPRSEYISATTFGVDFRIVCVTAERRGRTVQFALCHLEVWAVSQLRIYTGVVNSLPPLWIS